jgi:hypothetical protein
VSIDAYCLRWERWGKETYINHTHARFKLETTTPTPTNWTPRLVDWGSAEARVPGKAHNTLVGTRHFKARPTYLLLTLCGLYRWALSASVIKPNRTPNAPSIHSIIHPHTNT